MTVVSFKVQLRSRFSRVRVCVTPWTAAYQTPPSMGFSRQQYWSGVPLHDLAACKNDQSFKSLRKLSREHITVKGI